MKKLLLSGILFTLYPVYASECPSIVNDIARLACYDNQAKKNENEDKQESTLPAKKENEWIVDIRESPLNDEKEVTLMKMSDENANTRSPAFLIFRCERNSTEAYVSWREYIGSDNMKVSYRTDKDEAKTVWWNPSSNGQATFIPKPISFINSLEGKNSIYIEAEKYRGGRVSGTFDLTGLQEAIIPLRGACNW